MIKAWVHFFDKCGDSKRRGISESLVQSNIEICPFSPEISSGHGLLFFCSISEGLCDFLCKVSHSGLERVLAIAVSRAALSDGDAFKLLGAGASDVFSWDHSENPAMEISAKLERWESVDVIARSPLVRCNLVGEGPQWNSLVRQIVEIARYTDAAVLITGETGTGKELVARIIHTLDSRPGKGDLVIVDCTTIVPELAGSEFFGHERGAFTGAIGSRDGAFALADHGTLLLDEVGDLPLRLQMQLLRVVQEHMYKRVGGNRWQKTDFRLVCATNKDLMQGVKNGTFRSDLYYRLANVTLKMPPLRKHPENIIPLADHFVRELRSDEECFELDGCVREYLIRRAYPGNVRDLKQLVSRMIYRHVGPGPITLGDIPEEERPVADLKESAWFDGSFEAAIRRALSLGIGLKDIGRAAEDIAERIVVSEEDGNLQNAAKRLQVTDRALQIRRAARRRAMQNESMDEE